MATRKKYKPLVESETIDMGCGEKITITGLWTGQRLGLSYKYLGGLVIHLSTKYVPKLAISGKALKAVRELVDRAEATIEK